MRKICYALIILPLFLSESQRHRNRHQFTRAIFKIAAKIAFVKTLPNLFMNGKALSVFQLLVIVSCFFCFVF